MNLLNGFARWFRVAIQVLFVISTCTITGASSRNNKVIKPDNTIGPSVRLVVSPKSILVKNDLVEITLTNPGGDISGIKYGGLVNFLEPKNSRSERGYLDLVWSWPEKKDIYDKVHATKFSIITQSDDVVELSFVRAWDNSSSTAPLNIDKRYIFRRNVAGVYVYAIYEHPQGWPAFELGQTRIAYKLNGQRFRYMAVSDQRQRIMPTPKDRETGRTLAYKEAVLLTNPSNPDLKGEVDDKYQYSAKNEESAVHGWISEEAGVGFWMITPSYEFRTCGPMKQELTSHVGPVTLNAFMTQHYAGKEAQAVFSEGEAWKKVFGPVFIYLNKLSPQQNTSNLWQDAKSQMSIETENWPYNFTTSEDFPHFDQRGTVSGQLLVRDRYINMTDMFANFAYIGLAKPGNAGSWQTEMKGYQFWTRADSEGRFVIKNIRPGIYNLYAWVTGFVGNYKYDIDITVIPGSQEDLRSIVYEPPRNGPTLWEIGVPDRSAGEFYVPEASPTLLNKLYIDIKQDWFRQYGLWQRYAELYPRGDVVYTVGKSNWINDWFFAHVTRNAGNNTFTPTTWTVNFDLQEVVDPKATYTLQMALASANMAEVQVRFNDPSMGETELSTGLVGRDNAIARHGVHGLYHLYSFNVSGAILHQGSNTMFLTQSRCINAFQGVMYDYIRLEAPSSSIIINVKK